MAALGRRPPPGAGACARSSRAQRALLALHRARAAPTGEGAAGICVSALGLQPARALGTQGVVSTRRRRHVGDPFEEVRLVASIDYYLLNALVHVRRAREELAQRSFEAAEVYVREAVRELEEALRLLEQAAAVAAGSSQGRAKR